MGYKFLISILFIFIRDPETVHHLALVFLKILGVWPLSVLVELFSRIKNPVLVQKVFGLTFENPVGLAAGLDKEGQAVPGLEALGFGFIEVGTVTHQAQDGNPRPRIFRFDKDKAIMNRMGFNNKGASAMQEEFARINPRMPMGISIGKSKVVPLEKATEDYQNSFRILYEYGDYFAINISSPNTPGLRELQDRKFLLELVQTLNTYRKAQNVRKPILIKIAPDLALEAIDEVLAVSLEEGIDGIIATNTTTDYSGLSTETKETGGLSGKPLQKKSTEIIRHIRSRNPNMPIIGVGGIFTAEDAYEKIKAGASLIQVYTGFIYEGPFIVRNINAGLIRLLKRDGFKNISEAVGKE